jgi:hypothetical protein
VAKYAEKGADFKAEGDFFGLQEYPGILPVRLH